MNRIAIICMHHMVKIIRCTALVIPATNNSCSFVMCYLKYLLKVIQGIVRM